MQSDCTINISSASELLRCQVCLPLFVESQCTDDWAADLTQSPRGFSALTRLYYLARPTKPASVNIMQIALPADITLRGKVAECRLPWKTEVNPNARHRETCFSWNRLSKFNRKGKLKFFTVFYCLGYFISVTVSLRKRPFLPRSTPLGTFRMLSQAMSQLETAQPYLFKQQSVIPSCD